MHLTLFDVSQQTVVMATMIVGSQVAHQKGMKPSKRGGLLQCLPRRRLVFDNSYISIVPKGFPLSVSYLQLWLFVSD